MILVTELEEAFIENNIRMSAEITIILLTHSKYMHSLFRIKRAVNRIKIFRSRKYTKETFPNVTFCLLCDIIYKVEGVGDRGSNNHFEKQFTGRQHKNTV